MKHVKFILGLISIVIVIVISYQNYQALTTNVVFEINLIIFQFKFSSVSVGIIAVIAFLLGAIVMGVYDIVERFNLKKQIKNFKNTSLEKDKELNSLRNLPITSENVGSEPANNT